ncbi:MAG TPA: serine hydrolase domain-containing protein [Terracidiphilus sp.]|nr:serine hydrolase domain-containing protein [Terracidiphilus sp.]
MSAASSPTQNELQSRFPRVYDVLSAAIAARSFPGCAFGVFANNAVQLQDALGRFTYEDASPAITINTAYDIASVTKVVATTAACMLLHQRGKLDLDSPLGDFLPAFVIGRDTAEGARHIRIRHLLAHSSGLPGYIELFRKAATPEELLRACLQLPIEGEPGTRAEYSDIGFILLGKAIEVITGEDLAAWVAREVFGPLGLASTAFAPAASMRDSIPPTEDDATFRHRRIQGEVQDENAFILNGVAGHAGVFSTVPDLLRFAEAILAPFSQPDSDGRSAFFQTRTVECFATRQGPKGSSRALGWDTPSENSSAGRHFSAHSVGHLGYSGCSLWIDLDARLAVALLTNRTWPDRQNQAIRELRPRFHDAVRETL